MKSRRTNKMSKTKLAKVYGRYELDENGEPKKDKFGRKIGAVIGLIVPPKLSVPKKKPWKNKAEMKAYKRAQKKKLLDR